MCISPEVRRRIYGSRGRCPRFAALCVFFLTSQIVLCLGISAHAQSAEQDWEHAAGGKQEFDAASVREDKTGGQSYSNINLSGVSNAYRVMNKSDLAATDGSLLAAKNQSLMRYIIFAYRLSGTQELALRFDFYAGLGLHVPEWVRNSGYDIEARAPGRATNDQMRLMMQSLLAERFKLVVHWEKRDVPVFALVEDKPGKLGPQLEPHHASDDCATTTMPEEGDKAAVPKQLPIPSLSSLPIPCGWIAHLPASELGAHRFGGRNVTLAMLAESMPTQTGLVTLPRPVIDKTGLAGGYDFWLGWTPEDTSEVDNHESGGTFREALKNQLGLKLVPAKGPVEVLVVDHVEKPSAN